MSLGHNGKLFLLAFDHRASLAQGMFGILGRQPTPPEQEQMWDVKWLVWEGFRGSPGRRGTPRSPPGCSSTRRPAPPRARAAREAGVLLAVAVEESGRHPFEFEYGEDFAAHLEAFDPAFGKALVRWNPADDGATKAVQAERLRRLGRPAATAGPQAPVRVDRSAHAAPGGPGGRSPPGLRRPSAARPDAGGHLRDPGGRDRAGRVEDRGPRRARPTAPSSPL